MYPYKTALNIIKTFEGFNEKAYSDPESGGEPYTIGHGTQFYPDGTAVKQGHMCTKKKALEYVLKDINLIAHEIKALNLGLYPSALEALISFVHSIGWEAFLYSEIIDQLDRNDYKAVTESINQWVFDKDHQVIGGLLDRRRQEVRLFLQDIEINAWPSDMVLLKAFRNYSAAPHQVRAIRELESAVSPYVLSEFANAFCVTDTIGEMEDEELRDIFSSWS
jgi:lysozyme